VTDVPAPRRVCGDCDALVEDCECTPGYVTREIAPDPHALTSTGYPWGIAVVCACGQWECAVTGPASAAWARRDHERHRTLAG
jgi:hypothetical protein